MKLGVPWSVVGIRPEARETAREAARRSGMSLGDWLNTVILEQSADDQSRPARHEDEGAEAYAAELAGVHEQLEDLTRRISQFSKPASRTARRREAEPEAKKPDQLADLIGRLDQRIDQLVAMSSKTAAAPVAQVPHPAVLAFAPPSQRPQAFVSPTKSAQAAPARPTKAKAKTPPPVPPAIDRALAEIAARQRALNGTPAGEPAEPVAVTAAPRAAEPAPVPPAPVVPRVPAQDLSGLEDQLRKITDQIETLRKPGVEEAINALRGELGDISRALTEAMPRRSIETIEHQISGLTQRIAEGRQAGVDQKALSNLEQGLAEVRDALRGLTPAENLVGFNDAVESLAHKIDLIVAQKDPETLQRLEHTITTLREMATHVASNDAVNELATQVQALGERVEEIGRASQGHDIFNHLEARIEALTQALYERSQNGTSVPPRLEALVQSLSDKIEAIQDSRGEHPAIIHLDDRISHLVERLDASDSRLNHLEAIERGLGDLLLQIDEMRASRHVEAQRHDDGAVGALKQDIARTQDALESVNGTLSVVVDRLARIESDIREEGRRRAEAEPLELTDAMARAGSHAAMGGRAMPMDEVEPVMPRTAAPPLQPQQPSRRAQAKQGPINPDLPEDQPLEPGSGPPRQRTGARIAVEEAKPAISGSSSSFIAAARRAAQNSTPASGRGGRDAAGNETAEGEAPGGLMKRMKSLFVAASIVAIAVGTAQVGGKYLFSAKTHPAADTTASTATQAPEPEAFALNDVAENTAPALTPASPLAAAPAPALTAPSSIITDPRPMIPSIPSPLAAPALTTMPAKTDITGSIPQPARPAATANGLPTEIGGAKLRSAALAGNPAAAYEIGTRFAEGRGVPANQDEAARWYERAAAKGVAMAQFRYASMLEKGHGVKKDLVEARRLYMAAAGQGNAKAMHNLAVLYAEGAEGRPDYETAAKWFRKAADHGVADSEYNLGVLAARGLGTPKNLVESYKWFALAAAQGDKEAARKRDDVAAQLDAEKLAEAQKAVKGFVAQPQPESAISVSTPPGGWDAAGTAVHSSKAAPNATGTYKVGAR